MARPRSAVSWSGGKDSCLALMRAWSDFDVVAALTMFDEPGARSRSHGLRPAVVAAQTSRLGLTAVTASCSWATYEEAFVAGLRQLAEIGCSHVVFGDVFGDDHRQWTERVTARIGLTAVQPLWQEPTAALAREFLARGGEARLVTVRAEYLDESWLGRALTREALAAFEAIGVDPGGERGEYHTVVTNCPLFASPLLLSEGRRVSNGGCWAVDLLIDAPEAAIAPQRGGGHHAARSD